MNSSETDIIQSENSRGVGIRDIKNPMRNLLGLSLIVLSVWLIAWFLEILHEQDADKKFLRLNSVQCLAYSPNGKWVVAGDELGTIVLLDTRNGSEIRAFAGHTYRVNGVAVSSDNTLIASVGDETIRLWDTMSGKSVRTLTGHGYYKYSVHCVAFNHDDSLLATGGGGHVSGRVWNLASGELAFEFLEGHPQSVEDVTFSPNGKLLAVATANFDDGGKHWGEVRLWDVEMARETATIIGPKSFSCVAFSPNGQFLAAGSDDGMIWMWHADTHKLVRQFKRHRDRLLDVLFDHRSERLMSCGYDHLIKMWDVSTGNMVGELKGHNSTVKAISISPDGTKLASASHDHTIRLWDLRSRGW